MTPLCNSSWRRLALATGIGVLVLGIVAGVLAGLGYALVVLQPAWPVLAGALGIALAARIGLVVLEIHQDQPQEERSQ